MKCKDLLARLTAQWVAMMNLRELTEEQSKLIALVDTGVMSLEDISDHLDMVSSCRKDKIESTLAVITQLKSDAKAAEDEAKRLQYIAKVKGNSAKSLTNWVRCNMEVGEKIDFKLFSVSKGKGLPVVNITDESMLVEKYKVVTTSIDRKTLLSDLKIGMVMGAELAQGEPSLRIK